MNFSCNVFHPITSLIIVNRVSELWKRENLLHRGTNLYLLDILKENRNEENVCFIVYGFVELFM